MAKRPSKAVAVRTRLTEQEIRALIPDEWLAPDRLRDLLLGEALDFLHYACRTHEYIHTDVLAVATNVITEAHYCCNGQGISRREEIAERLWRLRMLFPPGSLGRGAAAD
jgi:hypothetical protein